jgi:hypothetical protein
MLAARIADQGFEPQIFDRANGDAPAFDEGERAAREIACEPGADGGRQA